MVAGAFELLFGALELRFLEYGLHGGVLLREVRGAPVGEGGVRRLYEADGCLTPQFGDRLDGRGQGSGHRQDGAFATVKMW